jgi:alpha-glucosidase (family GH31 glycosyl hydrolase)
MADTLTLPLLPGELWWGGLINSGTRMPFAPGTILDLSDMRGNCGQPLLISNRGRVVWSEAPFRFAISTHALQVTGDWEGWTLQVEEGFDTLRGAYRHAAQRHFPTHGEIPAPLLFTAPQYNTWMEMTYTSTQQRVLDYASDLLRCGFPPGVLIIDTLWHPTYGTWVFDAGRYPDPKGMVARLNEMGFQVMLWMVPYVTADTVRFRDLRRKGYLIKGDDGHPVIIPWWDGYSAGLDLLNPDAVAWLHEQMDMLVNEIGVAGFKMDGGQPQNYAEAGIEHAHRLTHAWNRIGLRYRYIEYKDSWKCAGLPLAQRIRDRFHSWDQIDGLQSLIPMGLEQGLMGYTFTCPDMVGGGEYGELGKIEEALDPELFVRYAQNAALFPMMQFSLAPWKLLDDEHLAICVKMAQLHAAMGDEILTLARKSAATGEPIMRHLAYAYPESGYEAINDQFLLGEDILVAPVVNKGMRQRVIVFPPGRWSGDDGSTVQGPCTVRVEAPLARLPWYLREVQREGS